MSVFLIEIGFGVEIVALAEMVPVLVILLGGTYLVFVPVCYVNSWD